MTKIAPMASLIGILGMEFEYDVPTPSQRIVGAINIAYGHSPCAAVADSISPDIHDSELSEPSSDDGSQSMPSDSDEYRTSESEDKDEYSESEDSDESGRLPAAPSRKKRSRCRLPREDQRARASGHRGRKAYKTTDSDGKRISVRRRDALTIEACKETQRTKGLGCNKDPNCLENVSPRAILELRKQFGTKNEHER